MRGSFRLALALCAQLLACGDDDGCPTEELDGYCQGRCVEGVDAAIAQVCRRGGGQQQWFEAENDCGGKTIESDANFTGVVFHFDAKEKIVGVSTWTDSAEDECGFSTVYGQRCKAEKFTGHDCSTLRDEAGEP